MRRLSLTGKTSRILIKANKEAIIKQSKEAFLQRLIDNMLIEQEAKKSGAGIIVKDEEIMEVIQGNVG